MLIVVNSSDNKILQIMIISVTTEKSLFMSLVQIYSGKVLPPLWWLLHLRQEEKTSISQGERGAKHKVSLILGFG